MHHYRPKMDSAAVLSGEHWRIGLITDSLLRLEWSDDGVFEDSATLTAVNRDFGDTPDFTSYLDGEMLVVETDALRLTYDMRPFSKEGLSAVVKGVKSTKTNTWHYGDAQEGNLGGTARTLDWADGPIPLSEGVVSRDGWAVLDDSSTNLILDDGTISPRGRSQTDLYLFGYGHRYPEAVADFYKLSGSTPLLPRWSLGNWWSRFHRYSGDEYLALLDRFEEEGIPFTTAVIDMDWHLVDDVDPKYGSGWTGYTWNRKLFPQPERFLDSVHERGYHTTLNVHPRDGVRAFEDAYPDVARAMGVDPASGRPIEFDLTDPDFAKAYFDMHHRLEDQGVDFWWIDWQQGGVTRQKGLDPLWLLNRMHFLDSGRDGRWPLTFSRYAGPGSHRYPVGFSGDTIVTWESLSFQPYFTATASNIGYGWWSHDIGGHMFGYRDEELEARWYQLGAFSPINRLHSTDSPFNGKEPWNFEPPIRGTMDDSLRLRHALLPYLYTMNWRSAVQGRPLVEPMYWFDADNDMAYEVPNEFMFGTEMLVAPITEPMDAELRRAHTDLWLPQGDWFDLFDGRRYESKPAEGRRMSVWRGLDRIPVFAKAGAIVPMQPVGNRPAGDGRRTHINSTANPDTLEILVFPGASGSFVLVEDDGTTPEPPLPARTRISFEWRPSAESVLHISPVAGDTKAVPASRSWHCVLRGVSPCEVRTMVDGEDTPAKTEYDADTLSTTVTVNDVPTNHGIDVFLKEAAIAPDPYEKDSFAILKPAKMRYLTKERAYRAIRRNGVNALTLFDAMEHVSGPSMEDCSDSHMPSSVRSALKEVLLRN